MFETGYFQDQEDYNDFDAEQMLFGAESASRVEFARKSINSSGPLVTDLRAFNPSILHQGNIGSCVPHAICKQIQMSWIIEGLVDAPLPNRLALFWQSRKYHAGEKSTKGTYPRLSYKAVQEYGFCREDVYKYDPSRALKPVPPKVYQSSFDQSRKLQYYRISNDSDARKRSIVESLLQFRPVTLGIQVDDNFLDSSAQNPWSYSGPSLGGHYILAVGHSEDGVLILNSWGESWSNQGYRLIRWETILNKEITSDPYVITFVPRIE